MKKHLFLIASVFAVFSLQAQEVSTVKILANTNVKVGSGTLFYVNGDMAMGTYTESNKKFSNEGKVRVTEKLKISSTSTSSSSSPVSFVNEYVGPGKYGQLIVDDSSIETNDGSTVVNGKVDGKIASVIKPVSGFSFVPLAIPYADLKSDVLVNSYFEEVGEYAFYGYKFKDDDSKKYYYDGNRWRNALFTWNNEKYQLDHVAKDINLVPTSYYAVNTTSYSGGKRPNTEITLKGTPFASGKKVEFSDYSFKGKTNRSVDEYGDAYGSYIVDFTTMMPDKWRDYKNKEQDGNDEAGARIYNLGNPYTSNINLTKGFLKKGVTGGEVMAFTQYTPKKGTYMGTLTVEGVGDRYLGIVAPFGTFAVKMKKPATSSTTKYSFTFNNDMKTFEDEIVGEEKSIASMFGKNKAEMPKIHQVGLDLYNADGFTGARAYVVASDIYEASQKGTGVETYNVVMSDKDMGIYTLQENEDGTVDQELAEGKAYINGVNANKYIAKPIHLVLQNGVGEYTLKARVDNDLNTKNFFYFEDKAEGKVVKVTKDFEYTFNANGTEKDRFVLYWAAMPNTKPVDDIVKEEASSTVVYKDFNNYKVRFDKSIKNAEIFVYNISGQLISSVKAVDTSVDYIVPLKGNTGVYILKVVGDNGKVVTKKIIK